MPDVIVTTTGLSAGAVTYVRFNDWEYSAETRDDALAIGWCCGMLEAAAQLEKRADVLREQQLFGTSQIVAAVAAQVRRMVAEAGR